jgi:hypothetical protein
MNVLPEVVRVLTNVLYHKELNKPYRVAEYEERIASICESVQKEKFMIFSTPISAILAF